MYVHIYISPGHMDGNADTDPPRSRFPLKMNSCDPQETLDDMKEVGDITLNSLHLRRRSLIQVFPD